MPTPPMRRVLEEAQTYASLAFGLIRFAVGLKAFLQQPISVEQAKAIVRRGMQTREAALLKLVEHSIFAHNNSPYLRLFQAAGCELGDVRGLVNQEGVEGTLRKLYERGIYVSHEEFKGRAPAVRGSQTFSFRDADFDNHLVTAHLITTTSGSGGRPSRILIDLDHLSQTAPHWGLWFAAHGLLSSPLLFLTPYYPGAVGHHLLCAKFGKKFFKWFATGSGGSPMYSLVTAYLHTLTRLAAGLPKPEYVPIPRIAKVGECLAALVARGMRPCINTSPSTAIRVCRTMQERGVSLRNVTFLLGYEPLTGSRRATIESSGAKAVPTYGSSEGGNVGSQCPNPGPPDDIHVSLDAYAAMCRPRPLPDGSMVNALLLTSLRSACPKVLLNAELGDSAVLETKQCGCAFDDLGYHQHLHTIRSFDKLTGEGVTFRGAHIVHLLEEVLPAKFGGTSEDYQLIEEQDEQDLPRYRLLVSPQVGVLNEDGLAAEFLRQLGRLSRPYRFMANQWAQAGLIQVERRQPIPTKRGKVMPFHTLGSSQ
jgi:hypothetical protein